MSNKKRGLGRGLDALLSSASPATAEGSEDELRDLPLEQLGPGRHQPRRHFDDEALTQLADSIRAQGVVQPIVVRQAGAGRYEIVAGERRWRAAKLAGLKRIPAVVRALDERGAMAAALVENIQRADLNPLEEAEALHKLIEECGLTHDQCASAIGRSRAQVTNLLRLMELNPDVQQLVRNRQLSLGHAKVLLGVNGARQTSLARLVCQKHLSVRQTEALLHAPDADGGKTPPARVHPLASQLTQRIGLPVKLQQGPRGQGRLTISFRDEAELQRLLGRLG
ncbi:MAG: ParB/RepB/Spo0J family partition protein [Gammaproteobacteria bacterium]|jgi:ParB family transcriptional regulator, chromosome partitioning protein